ncbi:MAG TPA: NYN domain-containing protein [Dehalococcoidia bacterium]|nr:NYN domain-containing protein [Dehalococcoidia bacterium]HIL31968.1 NYN domain-containing protein [Dehalococcoidia bacterium]
MQNNPNHGTDLALFIDWENFKISLAVGNRTPNISALKEEISNHGRVVIAKAYADWVTRAPELRGASQFLNDPPSLYAAGIEPVFVPTRAPSPGAMNANGMRTGRIKNSVDVKMTADCIEVAHTYPNIGTYVLVSGDSDFIHVVNALRTMGKHVMVVGVSWSTSRRLADQVDGLILYDVDVDPPPSSEPVTPSMPAADAPAPSPSGGDLQDIITAIEGIIRDERKAGGNPLLTSIKQRLVRRFPEFDEKKLGYTGFKRLMARVAQNGNIRLITAGLVDWAIMSDEDIPEGATEATFSGGGSNSRPGRRRGRLPRSRQQDEKRTPGHASSEIDDTSVIEDTENDYEPISNPESVNDNQTNGWQDRNDHYSSDRDREEIRSEEQTTEQAEEPSEPVSPFGDNLELARALQEAISNLDMPEEPNDGMLADRVSDLIFMANTLENQEGISHVAFNFLVSEICDALGQGLEAGHADITHRWGQSSSRTYVSKILRSLSDGEFFLKGNHSWRDETSGQNRRRRTFNLNQEHPLVQQTISARSGDSPDSAGQESSYDSDQNDPPQNSGASPRNSNDFARSVAADYADPNNNGEDEESSVQPGNERLPLFTDEEDDDYESGKSAAEARAETGFISRLFRPRRN